MAHGRNLQHDIHCRKSIHVRRRAGQRHQHHRPVRQQDPFGVPRGARGVHQGSRRVFVERLPVKARVRVGDPLFVGNGIAQARIGHVRAVREDNVSLDLRQAVGNTLEQPDETQVNEQHPVARLVDDVDDLIRKQPGIHRMVNRRNPANPVPAFKMPRRAPGQCANAITGLDALGGQPVRHLSGATVDLRVVRDLDRPFDRTGHNATLTMLTRSVFDDRVTKKWPVLHQAAHAVLPRCCLKCRRRRVFLRKPSQRLCTVCE